MATDSDPSANFRDRLSAIPKMGDVPAEELRNDEKPRVAKPIAPVARPHLNRDPEGIQRSRQARKPEGPPPERSAEPRSAPDFPPRRRRWPIVAVVLLGLVALVVAVPLLLASRTFGSIERVEVAQALSEPLPAGTNLLLIGTDSREGIDASTENSGAILSEGLAGSRTDTLIVLRLEDEGTKFLSIPRDLWLPIDGGDPQRINTAFTRGPEALVNTVQGELGIPISHFVEVDLSGFIELVDAVGGVEVTIPHPAFDRGSGLNLPTAGTVVLDSTQALAFVRSRFYTEIIDGVEVMDPTSDLGRVQRQQQFLRSLLLAASEERNPATINSMTTAIADALVIDDGTSLTEALALANTLRSSTPESVTLPTSPTTTSGGAQVLTLNTESSGVLAEFGGG